MPCLQQKLPFQFLTLKTGYYVTQENCFLYYLISLGSVSRKSISHQILPRYELTSVWNGWSEVSMVWSDRDEVTEMKWPRWSDWDEVTGMKCTVWSDWDVVTGMRWLWYEVPHGMWCTCMKWLVWSDSFSLWYEVTQKMKWLLDEVTGNLYRWVFHCKLPHKFIQHKL